MRHFAPALAAMLCLAAQVHAHGTRGYPPGAEQSNWKLFELAISSAHAGNVRFSVEGDHRIIRSDGLPDHETGAFPNRGNPNRISAQHYEMRVPAWPQPAIRNTPLQMQSFGFAINGVPFDPGAAEFWNNDRNWQYEAMSGALPLGLDQNNAHVQPNGAYHYHGLPTGLLARFANARTPVLVGWAAEVAVVGNEGVVGGSATLGIDVSHLRAVVQGGGSAVRITTAHLQSEMAGNSLWFRELYRFSHALMSQAAQTAACNCFHKVEARLARWLLATRDRMHSHQLHLTQEFLSQMLGVRRVGVTTAATNLQKCHLITYSRGNIPLTNPTALEAAACECYGAVKEIYRRSYRK